MVLLERFRIERILLLLLDSIVQVRYIILNRRWRLPGFFVLFRCNPWRCQLTVHKGYDFFNMRLFLFDAIEQPIPFSDKFGIVFEFGNFPKWCPMYF